MSQGRIIAIVPARMGSTRLPGKVLAPIGRTARDGAVASGATQPMLARVVERIERMRTLDGFIVATSVEKRDDAIAELCARHGWHCYRGPELDVLERTLRAAQAMAAEDVVMIDADAPWFSWQEADRLVTLHVASGADLSHNLGERGSGMPAGGGVEALTLDALGRAWIWGLEPRHRECVTQYVHERPDRFRVATSRTPAELERPSFRLCVDGESDLRVANRIHELLSRTDAAREDGVFDLREAVALLDENPELAGSNAVAERRAG